MPVIDVGSTDSKSFIYIQKRVFNNIFEFVPSYFKCRLSGCVHCRRVFGLQKKVYFDTDYKWDLVKKSIFHAFLDLKKFLFDAKMAKWHLHPLKISWTVDKEGFGSRTRDLDWSLTGLWGRSSQKSFFDQESLEFSPLNFDLKPLGTR